MRETRGIERAGIDHGGCLRIAAQHDQKVAHHCRLTLFVELHNFFFVQFAQRHLNHADRVLHDDSSRCDNGLCLLSPPLRLSRPDCLVYR